MKILVIHNNYKSKLLGGEDLVFKKEYAALVQWLGEENVYKYEVFNDDINNLELFLNIFYSYKHKKNISKLIKKERIDIVHLHNFFPLLSTSFIKGIRRAGAKIVHTIHNYRWWCIGGILYREEKGICELCVEKPFNYEGVKNKCYRNSRFQSLIAALAFYFYKRMKALDQIDYLFVLTQFQKNKLIELGISESKLMVKPNFNTEVETVSIDIENKHGFVFIGRLEESKGIYELIEHWKNINKKLTIIGDGPLRNFVEEHVSDNIQYLGKLENEKAKEVISKSKYLIQLSKWYETFGLTIIEAFQMGTPVIGLNIGTRSDFVINGYNGFLMDDFSDFIRTVNEADEYKHYYSMAKNSVDSSNQYSQEKIMKLQINLYNKILSENKKSSYKVIKEKDHENRFALQYGENYKH